jgi:hypothetical protein
MFFVLNDDDVLHVKESEDMLNGAFEGIDVENGVYRFFDASGKPLVAEFTVPNQRGAGFFGRVKWVRSGRYRLVPSDEATALSLADYMTTIVGLQSNPFFADLDAVGRVIGSR